MATAGFDPRAALDLWELMGCVEADAVNLGQSVNAQNKFGFLRTHPTSEERLKALDKDMEGAMKTWREHRPKRPGQGAAAGKGVPVEARAVAAVPSAKEDETGKKDEREV
jgi:predicted Zn-dependent protease